MDAQTQSNIMTTLQSEAFLCARYTLMAAEARNEGDTAAAELLEGISRIGSSEHIAELGRLVGLVGGDADNLVTAIYDESRQLEESYRVFAEQARAAGEYEVAHLFEQIRADKRDDVRALERELERLEVPT
jgi:rubrerythrin